MERIFAVAWAWYKFYGYGGEGQISVGWITQVIFFCLSSLSILSALAVAKVMNKKIELSTYYKFNIFSAISLSFCMVIWGLLLISPLTTFR